MSKIGIARGGFWLTALLPMLLLGWLTQGNAALAACTVVGLVATCSPSVPPGVDVNPGGIIYNPATNFTVEVERGVVINRAPNADFNGVTVKDTGGLDLTVNLADGVTITTSGQNADGVDVNGLGNISITSGANITASATTTNFEGTVGLLGRIDDAVLGVGNITIAQQAGSTITVTGPDAMGIYGRNMGFGSVSLTSSGIINVDGDDGFGIQAWNQGNAAAGSTSITLTATGSVVAKGFNATGLYNLNEGQGAAVTVIDGGVETFGENGDGVVNYVNNALSSAMSEITLSSTGAVVTHGYHARAVRAVSKGLGTVTIRSAGMVLTDGDFSTGLQATASDPTNAATMTVALSGSAIVATAGEVAHGIVANHAGSGTVDVSLGAGTSVTATGKGSRGIEVTAATGPANVDIGANAVVTGGWGIGVIPLPLQPAPPVPPVQSAGVMINSGGAGALTNLGIISAGSDRAVAGGPLAGNLTIENSGRITGFAELLGGGANAFVNNSGGLFDIRHFADTDGNGVRDTKRVAISDFGALGGSFTNDAGAMVRLAPVTGETSVDATSFYLPTVGPGAGRPLEASFYDLNRAGVVQGQMINLATFNNAGIIDLRGSTTGNTLVMAGGAIGGPATGLFTANGGTLLLNTVLNAGVAPGGQTGSHSDVLVVDGTQLGTGATTIIVDRREGSGALTPGNGILLVEVRNKGASAAGVFALNGDFVRDGNQAIVGGAHSYALFHNGVAADALDGNWYLRNVGLAPSVPVYEEYPKVLLPLIDVPTLQQRVGNRRWNEQAAPRTPRTVFCKDPAQNYQCAVTDEQASYYLDEAGTVVAETGGIWGRIVGGHGQYVPSASTSGARYDATLWGVQGGLDGLVSEGEDGTLIAGLTVNYGRSGAEITAPGSVGNITSSAYGLGATLTWYGANGFYADGQAQLTWLDSHLSSLTTGRSLVDGNKGFGQAFSLEAGQRITLGDHWTLTPQAQLTYSNVGFDSFTDPFGTSVSLLQGQSLSGRLGLAAEYQSSWKTENGTVSRLSAYGIANLEKELLDGTRVNVSGYEFASRDSSLWGGVGLGGTYNWDNNKYAIYGEVSANTSLERFGDSFELGGNIGLKVKW